ncbi:DUF3107 domain-containing protein [Actinomadura alba]|uniref:DUF3107 domain-containing protein n=1 Tax=Actinomadura alba TaxID=406431 RepID=A0ABR7M2V0_9ACTN|nr:DUF3107 domain-containing protein [Actinomadura alba]MBC6471243.1 DUF3107 domain-containing protein [Actinomadura alba]
MQVRIGVQLVPKELVVETSQSADEIERALSEALAADNGIFVLKDDRNGGRVVVPAAHVGYLEIAEDDSRRVGFGTM